MGTEFVDLKESAEDSSGYRSARTGPVPRLLPAANLTDDLDQAGSRGRLAQKPKDGEGPETIGVVVRTEQLVRALDERQVPSRFVSDKEVPDGKPVVMTMYRAKGMEFARVLIFGVDSSALPTPFALKDLVDAGKSDVLQAKVVALRRRDSSARWAGAPLSR